MRDRVRPKKVARVKLKRKRAVKATETLTDLGIERVNYKKRIQEINAERASRDIGPAAQFVIWDKGQRGLGLLVGPRTKTFLARYKLHGEWIVKSIGRFGEMVPNADSKVENLQIAKARAIVANYYALARDGVDPLEGKEEQARSKKPTYETVVDDFIEHYAKPRQRTWDQTERALKRNCRRWLKREFASITGNDVRTLLREFIAKGNMRKAGVTKAWLKTLWEWAYHEEKIDVPIIRGIDNVEIEKGGSDRVYSDEEIKAAWHAADKLPTLEKEYIKLMILLAPRKTALALMRPSEIRMVPLSRAKDAEKVLTWTTPHELVKAKKKSTKKRVYLTPLPALAQRLIKGITKPDDKSDLLFPGFPVYENKKWPAPGSEDTELGVLMEPEVGHGETEVYPRVQA